ncbi:MAG: TldD/PmbA family protein, partial [Methylobacter sp.]
MKTTLAIRPEFPEFDIYSALSWIKNEADWVSLRFVQEHTHQRTVRNQRPENNSVTFDRGVMVEAMVDGQLAYAGTGDLSEQGLREAARRASRLARVSAPFKASHFSEKLRPTAQGRFSSLHRDGLDVQTLGEFTDQLITASRHLKVSDKIVNTSAEATLVETWLRYVSSNGTDIDQQFLLVSNNFAVTAQDGIESQRRSMNGPVARCRQAGLEFFDFEALLVDCERVGRQALELLTAGNCPDETLDLVLAPDQMLLQIHESIGHPLELDRILGDERNYAGWSFVKPEDFGRLQYGSNLMNITFDPTVAGEFASYAFDNCGHP